MEILLCLYINFRATNLLFFFGNKTKNKLTKKTCQLVYLV